LRSGEAADSLVAPLTFSILSKRFGPLSSGTGVYLDLLRFLDHEDPSPQLDQ
jgi:hypothetical protein